MSLLKRFLPLLILLLAVLVFVLLRATRPEPPPAGDEERRWPIAVFNLVPQDLAPQLRLFGQLVSSSDIQLRARTAGDVAQVLVRSGEAVAAGQLLLVLEDLDAQALYRQRQAEVQELVSQLEQRRLQQQIDQQALEEEELLYRLAERQYQRQQQLAQTDRASARQVEEAAQALSQQRLIRLQRELALAYYPSQVQQLEAQLRRARAQQEVAARDLAATQLRAPAAMRIQEVLVAEGDRVTAHEPLVRLHRPDELELEARIPISALPQVSAALDQQTDVYATTELDGQPLVFRLQNLASLTTEGAGVMATFVLEQGRADGLALGRFIDAQLDLPVMQGVFWLPLEAVQGRNRVYRVQDGRLESLQVELLGEHRFDGQPGVLVSQAGITAGDQLLATRLPNAMQGLLIEIVSERGSAQRGLGQQEQGE